jgi:hypothetical protein
MEKPDLVNLEKSLFMFKGYCLWDVMPCSVVDICQSHIACHYLHLQRRRIFVLWRSNDVSSEFLWKAGKFLPDYMASHLSRQ